MKNMFGINDCAPLVLLNIRIFFISRPMAETNDYRTVGAILTINRNLI
jgi:hypothetical protein